MQYRTTYTSPLGGMLLASDGCALTGLWFEGQKYLPPCVPEMQANDDLPVFAQTKRWLDGYFSGRDPGGCPPLRPAGTEFQRQVWQQLCTIPYGQTVTYGQVAAQIARERGTARMSAQAVGGAVGHNPISVIVPCHRVLGANGALTGYAGGIEKKRALLALEGVKI